MSSYEHGRGGGWVGVGFWARTRGGVAGAFRGWGVGGMFIVGRAGPGYVVVRVSSCGLVATCRRSHYRRTLGGNTSLTT